VGPVPIVLTALSAYYYWKMIVFRRPTTAENSFGILFLPLGVVSLFMQLFFVYKYLFIYVLFCQIISSICSFLLAIIANRRSSLPHDFPRDEPNYLLNIKYLLKFLVFLFLYNSLIILAPLDETCQSARCYAFETAFGQRSALFPWVYLGGFIGSLLLCGVIDRSVQLIKILLNSTTSNR
jgi:hypothetical protein